MRAWSRSRAGRAALVVAFVMGAGVLAGCGGGDDDEAAVKVAGGGESKVEIETDEGKFSAGEGSELPKDFPDDFPVPDGADIQFSGSQESGGTSQVTVVFVLRGNGSEAYEYYLEALEKAGYEVTQKFSGESGDGFGANISFEGKGSSGIIIIGSDEAGKTSASVTLTKE